MVCGQWGCSRYARVGISMNGTFTRSHVDKFQFKRTLVLLQLVTTRPTQQHLAVRQHLWLVMVVFFGLCAENGARVQSRAGSHLYKSRANMASTLPSLCTRHEVHVSVLRCGWFAVARSSSLVLALEHVDLTAIQVLCVRRIMLGFLRCPTGKLRNTPNCNGFPGGGGRCR